MPQAICHKVWLITGASKGFGHVWTEAALARGDRVAAAARNIASLNGLKEQYGDKLLPLSLDVGDKKAVDAAVEKAARCGRRLPMKCTNFLFLQGYYRAAMAELRVALELVMIGAYGNLKSNDPDYIVWKNSGSELGFTL